MPDLIRDHVWRAPIANGVRARAPYAERTCEYLNCRRPRAEHLMSVDWEFYQKCSQVCGAELGRPCLAMSGFVVGVGRIEVEAAEPHTPRELRAGAK